MEAKRGSTGGEDGGETVEEIEGVERPEREVREEVKTKAVPLLDAELELVFVRVAGTGKIGLNSSSLSLGGGGDLL